MTQSVSTNFGPHFAPSPAPVAQWIERRFPKPQVACSIHAGGASKLTWFLDPARICDARYIYDCSPLLLEVHVKTLGALQQRGFGHAQIHMY